VAPISGLAIEGSGESWKLPVRGLFRRRGISACLLIPPYWCLGLKRTAQIGWAELFSLPSPREE